MTLLVLLCVSSFATMLVAGIIWDTFDCMRDVFVVAAGAFAASLLSIVVIDGLIGTCLQYQEECIELLKKLSSIEEF